MLRHQSSEDRWCVLSHNLKMNKLNGMWGSALLTCGIVEVTSLVGHKVGTVLEQSKKVSEHLEDSLHFIRYY